MASTTIKVSVETRDRIKAHGGATHEETIVAALDALDEEEFWAQAERSKTWLDANPEVKARIDAEIAERDGRIGRAR